MAQLPQKPEMEEHDPGTEAETCHRYRRGACARGEGLMATARLDYGLTLALRRILKPGGGRRMVEQFPLDWYAVPFWILKRRAERQGLRFESRLGPPFSYIARFLVPCASYTSENYTRKGSGKERRTGCYL